MDQHGARRFPPGAPADVEAGIRTTTDLDKVSSWLVSAAKADSIDTFPQTAGL